MSASKCNPSLLSGGSVGASALFSNVRGGVPLGSLCGECWGHSPGHGALPFLFTLPPSPPLAFCSGMRTKSVSPSVVAAPAVGGLDPVFVCWGCHNKHHGLGALTKESNFLPVPVAASPRARCRQGRLLLGLQTAVFSLHLHATVLCVCLLTPLLIKPPISGPGATLVTSFQLRHPFKDPVSKAVTF